MSFDFDSLAPDSDQYAVELVDAILDQGWQQGASDIHLHPRSDSWEILFRIDGALVPIATVPKSSRTDPSARLMVLAGLPTYKVGQPLEGRIDLSIDARDMRVGLFPTLYGQRAVIRLFRAEAQLHELATLGLGEEVTSTLAALTTETEGAILLTGPAGSGKTTTLYACLRAIVGRPVRRSVLTIEDPPESVLAGVSQSQIDAASGMSLAAALRSAVRQDPEVLLVSEIRDPETAEAALQASLTGHLVFSSLHAPDTATAVQRLVQMGLPPYLIRSGVRALCSQRLLRKRCVECRDVPLIRSGENGLRECPECLGVGYHGRVAIAELMVLDGDDAVGNVVGALLEGTVPANQIGQAAADAGMVTLAQRAWQLVEEGITDEAELYRVLGRRGIRH
ncbi:Putative type II secretion system protein E [Roseimaritima multifibrata]|uniref:Type II secretion system protein E n=1 Tax=Roseimaritima multifibrata TaxID=1930274 RepID=A0A517MKW4_9BACT|nr:GspE/PulE family protein [Roseimaritima multifibrata]QDS95528.1 Putative type II secretion system protein E [Roseimaritima multifibrata]